MLKSCSLFCSWRICCHFASLSFQKSTRKKYISKPALEEASFADVIYEALSPCPFQPCRRQFHPSLQGSSDLWSWNCTPVYMLFSLCSLSININVVYIRMGIIFISWSSSFSMDTSGGCPSTGGLQESIEPNILKQTDAVSLKGKVMSKLGTKLCNHKTIFVL